jgi:HD-like signal output (HDOD) protein
MRRDIAINLGNLMLSLSKISDMANPLIAQHQQRVALIALEMARACGADRQMKENIFAAALVHDIGAFSVEEKTAVHNFETIDPDLRRAASSSHSRLTPHAAHPFFCPPPIRAYI